jgi:hypothetical protein
MGLAEEASQRYSHTRATIMTMIRIATQKTIAKSLGLTVPSLGLSNIEGNSRAMAVSA